MFSVIIPTLNEEKFLPHLLDSLVEQTKKDFEVVVVDGSSQDKTVDVARSFTAKLPSLHIVSSTKASLPLQRNLGAKQAKGDWFIFIDADSVVFPHFIERMTQYIGQKKPAFVTTWFRPDSDKAGDAVFALLGNILFEMSIILKRPASPGPLTAVKRSVFFAVGGYDENHDFHEDVDLSLRINKLHIPLTIIPETLYVWSFRRFRKEGTLQVSQKLILSTVPVILFQQAMKRMPGYVMGGQIYAKRKRIKMSMLKNFEEKFKSLVKELFE